MIVGKIPFLKPYRVQSYLILYVKLEKIRHIMADIQEIDLIHETHNYGPCISENTQCKYN